MRIHIVGINYWPESTGIAAFSTGRAEYLAAQGHEVTMCTAMPYYPEWRVAEAYRRRLFATERRNGVRIVRCPLYVPSVVTPLRRVLHEASFVATALVRSLLCPRPDVLFIVSPPLGLALVAWILSRCWRVPYLFHVADLQPDAAVDLGMVKPGRVTRMLYAVERMAYRNAATVSTLTDAMRARIIAKGVPGEKVLLLPDWADPELFELPAPAEDDQLRRLGLVDKCVVLHIGNMGVKQGLEVVLAAAERSRQVEGVTYVLVGDGAMRPALEAQARARGLPNVRFVPLLPREPFLRLLAAADVCLVTQQRTVADIVFPSKVLTLLAAAKPVIASVTAASEVARGVVSAGAGHVVTPEDPDALWAAVQALHRDPATRSRMAAAGRAYARRAWNRETRLESMHVALTRLAARRSSTVADASDNDGAADAA
jgi:colanic acid biosynthesis glycosyl transferase WcaI